MDSFYFFDYFIIYFYEFVIALLLSSTVLLPRTQCCPFLFLAVAAVVTPHLETLPIRKTTIEPHNKFAIFIHSSLNNVFIFFYRHCW